MNSYLRNMPRKGISAAADFGDQIVEDRLQQDDDDFQSDVDFYNSNVHADQVAKAEFDAERSFKDKTGDFFMNVLSLPDRLDKAVGIYGTRQKAIKALTGGLSEEHMLASLAGEMLVPDTIDLVTLGLGYIPRRVLLKGPKMVKAFLKSKASRLPKYARKLSDDIPAGAKLASENDVAKMIAEAQNAAKIDAIEAEKVLKAQGKVNVTAQDINTELAQSGKRQFIDEEPLPMNDMADLTLRKANIDPNSTYGLKLKHAASKLPGYIKQNKGGAFYFDYDLFQAEVAKTGGQDGRLFLELFQTEFSRIFANVPTLIDTDLTGKVIVGGQGFKQFDISMMVNSFKPAAELLGLTGHKTLGRMDYSNVHHVAALKGIMGIYDKLGFNSPLLKQVNDRFYKKLKGLGGQSGNFKRLIGGTSDIGSPHYLAHVFLNQAIGKDGRKFFTPEVLARMNADDAFRLAKADELADIIADSAAVAEQAQNVYKAVADATLATEYDDVVRTMANLFDKDLLKMVKTSYGKYNVRVTKGIEEGRYVTRNFDNLIEDVALITRYKGHFPDFDMDKFLFNQGQLDQLRKMHGVFKEMAVNPKVNFMEISGTELSKLLKKRGVTFFEGGVDQKVFPGMDLPDNIKAGMLEKAFFNTAQKQTAMGKAAKTRANKAAQQKYFKRKAEDAKFKKDHETIKTIGIDTGELDEFGNPKYFD